MGIYLTNHYSNGYNGCMKASLSCSFFGHRNIRVDEDLKAKLKCVIELLITKENIGNFLFGSRSFFDDICYEIVSELQQKYPQIIKTVYPCSHESICEKHEKEDQEKLLENILHKKVLVKVYDKIVRDKNLENAGRFSYVERNEAMINDSDFCVFYYIESYSPPTRYKKLVPQKVGLN